MTVIKLALLISILIVGFAHGAPLQTVSSQSDSCSWWQYIRDDLKCSPETLTFALKIALAKRKVQDEESLRKIVEEACAPVQKCFKDTECLSDYFQAFKHVCDSFSYVSSPTFKTCVQGVSHTAHNCTKKHSCDFGTNNCQKNLVTHNCGHTAWAAYRTVVGTIHSLLQKPSDSCNYDVFKIM